MTTAPSSRPDGPKPTGSSLAKLVEFALVLPAEVGSRLVEVVPAVIDKVPSAAERVKREVVLARFLGKMVVDQGVRELRSRLAPHEHETHEHETHEQETHEHEEVASVAGARAPATPAAPRRTAPVEAAVDPSGGDGDAPHASTLALADYDHLSSAQIVGKLEGLDAAERRVIERYERAGRCRRTILGKLAQLEAHE